MKRGVVAVSTALSLVFAVPAFAVESSQPPKETVANFEQAKSDHLKKIDYRMSSLQQEKVCVQSAKNHDELRACRAKHRGEMKGNRGDMGRGGPGGMGGPPPVK